VTHDDESVTSELNTSLYSPGDAANIVPKLWVFPEKGYGLLVIEDLWVMVCKSPPTELVDRKNIWDFGVYGLSKSWVMRVSTVRQEEIEPSERPLTNYQMRLEIENKMVWAR
jgi:hypothetical protein